MSSKELLQQVCLKLDLANMELQAIDSVLSRHPALSGLTHRTEKIERACQVAADADRALVVAGNHLTGLAAYLATCAKTTIIENLETTIAALHQQAREVDAAIKKLRGTP